MQATNKPAKALFQRFAEDASGQDLIEYALLAAVIAVAVGAFLPPVGDSINVVFSKVMSLFIATPG